MAAALFLHPWRFCTTSAEEAEADLLALMDSHNESVAAGLGADGTLTPAQKERLRAAFGWIHPGVLVVFSATRRKSYVAYGDVAADDASASPTLGRGSSSSSSGLASLVGPGVVRREALVVRRKKLHEPMKPRASSSLPLTKQELAAVILAHAREQLQQEAYAAQLLVAPAPGTDARHEPTHATLLRLVEDGSSSGSSSGSGSSEEEEPNPGEAGAPAKAGSAGSLLFDSVPFARQPSLPAAAACARWGHPAPVPTTMTTGTKKSLLSSSSSLGSSTASTASSLSPYDSLNVSWSGTTVPLLVPGEANHGRPGVTEAAAFDDAPIPSSAYNNTWLPPPPPPPPRLTTTTTACFVPSVEQPGMVNEMAHDLKQIALHHGGNNTPFWPRAALPSRGPTRPFLRRQQHQHISPPWTAPGAAMRRGVGGTDTGTLAADTLLSTPFSPMMAAAAASGPHQLYFLATQQRRRRRTRRGRRGQGRRRRAEEARKAAAAAIGLPVRALGVGGYDEEEEDDDDDGYEEDMDEEEEEPVASSKGVIGAAAGRFAHAVPPLQQHALSKRPALPAQAHTGYHVTPPFPQRPQQQQQQQVAAVAACAAAARKHMLLAPVAFPLPPEHHPLLHPGGHPHFMMTLGHTRAGAATVGAVGVIGSRLGGGHVAAAAVGGGGSRFL